MKNNNNNNNNNNNDHGFILGEHQDGDITYKFRLAHRKYYILEYRGEGEEKEEKVLQQITNMTKAYEEWNKIKRPEKTKK